jgi:alpha-tubulin suppressor-like RCC1 family protein
MKCWGDNAYGEIGDGTTTNRTSPASVGSLSGVVAISVGWEQHTCALVPGGRVMCWGANAHGQLGDGKTNYGTKAPVQVSGL